MNTSAITTPMEHQDVLRSILDWSGRLSLAFAWATCTGPNGAGPHWGPLLANADKIDHAVVGTAFGSTEPRALRELLERVPFGALRSRVDPGGTFHPKVIVGTRAGEARALVGSANLTTAAFSHNTEIGVLLEGRMSDSQTLTGLLTSIAMHWSRASLVTADWIDRYEVCRHVGQFKEPAEDPAAQVPAARLYRLRGGVRALGRHVGPGRRFEVLAGATGRRTMAPSTNQGWVRLREQLLAHGTLAAQCDRVVLLHDHVFDAPTTAASILRGGRVGLREWLDVTTGEPLAKETVQGWL